ncbi:MAG: porin family protein [Paludibacter sp.]|nr:porin family protein [Paludibacter sp.]
MLKTKINKLTILVSVLLGLSFTAKSQGNLPYVDGKLIHFGFSLGLNAMDFKVTPKSDSVNARVSTLNPGFSVGIISDLRLNRYLNLRFNPTLHFGERQLSYFPKTGNDSIIISSIPINLPIYLKYSAERKGNFRPYLIWGAGISFDFATNKENPVLLKPVDLFTEFGVGCDIYFLFFKLAPELKYSVGFNNIFTPLDQRNAGQILGPNQRFSSALSGLKSRMLTLTFNFE